MLLLSSAIRYFAIVFAAGFALGTVRTLWLVPAVGEVPATLLELPVMLAASWWACGWVLRRWPVRPGSPRLAMGMVALALLLGAEAVLGLTLMGRSVAEQLAAWTAPAALIGLAGQLLLGLMPLFRR